MSTDWKPGDIIFSSQSWPKSLEVKAHKKLSYWFNTTLLQPNSHERYENVNKYKQLEPEQFDKAMIVELWPDKVEPIFVQFLFSEGTLWLSAEVLCFLEKYNERNR